MLSPWMVGTGVGYRAVPENVSPTGESLSERDSQHTVMNASSVRATAGVDARILDFKQEIGDFEPGETVVAKVEVENTGDVRHTFFVGYGVQGPDREWYNNDGQTGTTVTLDPYETEWVRLRWTVESDAPPGEYGSRTSVWEESDRDNLHTRLADRSKSNVFEVVEATNRPPDAEMECTDTDVSVGETVTCTADRSTDSDGSIESYEWNVDGRDIDSGETLSYTFDHAGDYGIGVTVTDDDGATSAASRMIDVEEDNERPVADISCSPTEVAVGEVVECSAGESYDSDGTIREFDWNLEDGTNLVGDDMVHTFSESGLYSVELTVTDDEGATDETTETIRVEEENEPPTADISCSPTDVTVGETVECWADGSADSDGTIEAFDWSFGDGTTDFGENVTHTFEEPGTYSVELEVTDDSGVSDTASETVYVAETTKPPAVELSCSPTEVTVGEPVECWADGSADSDGTIEEFDWSFGDGATGFGEDVTHAFEEPGTYSVELEVTDDDELTASESVTISVETDNEGPNAHISYSPTNLERGDTVRFDASESTDPDGRITEYRWQIGDTVKYGETVRHTIEETGDYDVELVVTDGDGASDTATQSVSVLKGPTAEFSFSPKQPQSGQSISFEAERDSRIERYEWDFDGDGEYEASGRKVTQQFDSAGKHSVKLHVVGKGGMDNTATEIVTVQQNAYFQLTANRATVEAESGTAVVMFSASNHVNDESLQVKLELDLPAEGVSIQSVAGESPVSRKSTDFFEVEAGADESFRVRLQVNEPGAYDIGGKAVYYYAGQDDRRSQNVGPITVGTKAAVEKAAAEETKADGLDSTTETPGFGPGVAVAGLVVAVWIASRWRP
ncbi:PKD domain-containing protein [Halorussus ruber]|uniref:PKD domain-containing protein n=1 Tax=Halorussus ruber TaxID=1126238 RepID=UPI00143DC93B|nr:PKD domain-containing protein [Halorussus ruber]